MWVYFIILLCYILYASPWGKTILKWIRKQPFTVKYLGEPPRSSYEIARPKREQNVLEKKKVERMNIEILGILKSFHLMVDDDNSDRPPDYPTLLNLMRRTFEYASDELKEYANIKPIRRSNRIMEKEKLDDSKVIVSAPSTPSESSAGGSMNTNLTVIKKRKLDVIDPPAISDETEDDASVPNLGFLKKVGLPKPKPPPRQKSIVELLSGVIGNPKQTKNDGKPEGQYERDELGNWILKSKK